MDIVQFLIDLFLHLDEHLSYVISQYGVWTYALLFFVIFMETGFVVTPFLPGDSLIFAAGTFAAPEASGAPGPLNLWLLLVLLIAAAFLGDTANYWIGHYLGDRAYKIRWIKQEYIERTHAFFEKHGGKTILLARFVPIVRTFAPFVAGIGRMSYGYFISYNIVGGIVWVSLFSMAGYFFGRVPFVQENFTVVVIAIIAVSVLPMVIEALKARRESRRAPVKAPETH